MLDGDVPVLMQNPVILREFGEADVPLIQAAAEDPMIPLITTVPSVPSDAQALAYIVRQHGRRTEGVGYSFAVALVDTDEAVGQIGLWLYELQHGRASGAISHR